MTDADREIMHELLDRILDSKQMSATQSVFFPGIPGELADIETAYRLELKDASVTVIKVKR